MILNTSSLEKKTIAKTIESVLIIVSANCVSLWNGVFIISYRNILMLQVKCYLIWFPYPQFISCTIITNFIIELLLYLSIDWFEDNMPYINGLIDGYINNFWFPQHTWFLTTKSIIIINFYFHLRSSSTSW